MSNEQTVYDEANELVAGAIGLPIGAMTALQLVISSAQVRERMGTPGAIEDYLNAHDGLERFCSTCPAVLQVHARVQVLIND